MKNGTEFLQNSVPKIYGQYLKKSQGNVSHFVCIEIFIILNYGNTSVFNVTFCVSHYTCFKTSRRAVCYALFLFIRLTTTVLPKLKKNSKIQYEQNLINFLGFSTIFFLILCIYKKDILLWGNAVCTFNLYFFLRYYPQNFRTEFCKNLLPFLIE